MMFFNQLFIVAALSLAQGKEPASEMPLYHQMPPFYNFDEYDYCMMDETGDAPTYCLVNAEIIPDASVLLWQQISNFSSNAKQHFRHDNLVFGKCLNWCMHLTDVSLLINNLETGNKMQDIKTLTSYTYDFENRTINVILQKCINEAFHRKYGLSVRTNVEYCDRKGDYLETDVADIIFCGLLCILLILCFASSLYDFWLKKSLPIRLQSNEHYKRAIIGNGNSYLVTFSITRNWYRLSMPSNKKYGRDLRSLDCIKFVLMICVITCHLLMVLTASPIANPEFIEDFFTHFVSIIFLNGWIIIQAFFAISGLLLTIGVLNYFNRKPLTSCTIIKIIFLRYLRYITVYVVVLLFEASILAKLSDGPFWKHTVYNERNLCRENWWVNLLFVNNYVKPDEPCLIQCWYLATDFQLYILNLLILALILKCPNRKKMIIGIGIIISVALPGLTVYFQNLDGVFVVTPEIIKSTLLQDKGFKDFYKPTHMNFGSYFIGVISGFLFIQYKKEKRTFDDQPRIVFFAYFMNVLAILFLLSGYMFYYWDFPKPSLWAAIYATLFRNFWGIYSISIIFSFSFGIGWVAREFACHPLFRVLGRLTYGAYICHFTIIHIIFGSLRQPMHISYASVFAYTAASVMLSYGFSLILALVVELPTSVFLKSW